MRKFYICSYGGSGSKLLTSALSRYGMVYHIHSKKPPSKLEYIGCEKGGNTYHEWFNGVPIPDNELQNYIVIYIYRNPVKSIISRFNNPNHLRHIQVENINIKIDDIVEKMKDLYDINGFYNNYTKPDTNNPRNYKIINIRYKDIFEKQDEISKWLGVGPLHLVKKERNNVLPSEKMDKLNEVYQDLIMEMENNDFIFES